MVACCIRYAPGSVHHCPCVLPRRSMLLDPVHNQDVPVGDEVDWSRYINLAWGDGDESFLISRADAVVSCEFDGRVSLQPALVQSGLGRSRSLISSGCPLNDTRGSSQEKQEQQKKQGREAILHTLIQLLKGSPTPFVWHISIELDAKLSGMIAHKLSKTQPVGSWSEGKNDESARYTSLVQLRVPPSVTDAAGELLHQLAFAPHEFATIHVRRGDSITKDAASLVSASRSKPCHARCWRRPRLHP